MRWSTGVFQANGRLFQFFRAFGEGQVNGNDYEQLLAAFEADVLTQAGLQGAGALHAPIQFAHNLVNPPAGNFAAL